MVLSSILASESNIFFRPNWCTDFVTFKWRFTGGPIVARFQCLLETIIIVSMGHGVVRVDLDEGVRVFCCSHSMRGVMFSYAFIMVICAISTFKITCP